MCLQREKKRYKGDIEGFLVGPDLLRNPHLDRILALKTGAIQVLETLVDKDLIKEKLTENELLKEEKDA